MSNSVWHVLEVVCVSMRIAMGGCILSRGLWEAITENVAIAMEQDDARDVEVLGK